MRTFPHSIGAKMATAPIVMKQIPMTGTTLTENAPPVTTPVPYKSNHIPGNISSASSLASASDINAPASSGGARLSVNFLPGPDMSFKSAARAFRFIITAPIVSASGNSPAQTIIHSCSSSIRDASNPATTALTPIITPPQPGTAVNDEARSIVSRMYFKLSIARPCNDDGITSSSSARIGSAILSPHHTYSYLV